MNATGDIRLQNLTLGYDRHPAVHHVTGRIAAGERLAIIGPNGAGKSTLIKGIAGVLRPLSGEVQMKDVARRGIAFLPQMSELDRSFPIRVYDLVAMGAWHRLGLFGGLTKAERQRVGDAIAAVGLSGFEERAVGTLSGGQLQRALFARLLLQDAQVILLDEPFAAIDTRTVSDLVAVIHGWSGEGRTVIAVLHDMDLVREHFPTSLLLARETIAWGHTTTVLTDDNLDRARRMNEAFDESAHICARPDAA